MNYIEKILNDFEDDFGPSATVPDMKAEGGRIGYNQGSSLDSAVRTIDPVQDSGNKIEEVLKAYGRYQGNRKGGRMSFSKFFELYATENFATGGSAGQLVQPSDDGSRPGYSGVVKNVKPVEGTSHLFTAESGTGKKFYLSKFSSQNPEAGPGMKKRFPLTKEGKVDAIKAIESHIKEYPNIFKRPEYKGQTTIKKRADGVLTYAKRGAPTKTYDPKEYGSETKAFKAAKKDVEASQVSKKTAAVKDINIEKVKELRAKGISIKKIADELGVEQRTISDRLIKAGESTKDLSIRVIPKEVQKDLIAKYPQIKNWDFKKHTLGFPYSENKQLYSRVQDFLSDPKPYEIAGDFSKADGWLAAQMNRSYKLGNKNFIPIKAMVNNKNKIVGFIDNTEFGGGGKYIVNEKFIKGKNADGVLMSLHPDYEDTAKFVDVSKKAKLPVQGVLKNLLKNEGIDTTRISLSDLFKYMKGEVGVEGTKSALEKHHISGVKNRATGNYQLLDRDLNALAKYVSQEIEVGDLSRVGELKKKGVMVEVDGQTYGSGPKTPKGQFKRFEKQITNFFQNDPNAKKIIKNLNPKNQQLIKNQFCPGNKVGGPPGACDISEAMDNMIKQTNAVKQGAIKGTEAARIAEKASKVARFGTGKGLGAVLGPLGLAGEAVFEVAMAVPGYGKGKSGKRLLGDSLLGLIPGVGQSLEEEFTEYATKDGMQDFEQQKIKDANRFLELNNSLPSALKNIDKGGRGNPLAGSQTFDKQYDEYSPLYDQFVGGPPSESASTALAEQRRINDLIKADEAIRAEKRNIAMDEDFMAAGGGIAKMAGDRSGPPPVSGPQPQGLSYLFNRVKKV